MTVRQLRHRSDAHTLAHTTTQLIVDQHAALELRITAEAIPALVTLYGGVLFSLVTTPTEWSSKQVVHGLARAIVQGALPDSGGVARS